MLVHSFVIANTVAFIGRMNLAFAQRIGNFFVSLREKKVYFIQAQCDYHHQPEDYLNTRRLNTAASIAKNT